MASRTPEFREEVLRLDNYQCQICGFDGRDEKQRGFLEADHVIPRAGKASMDDPDNGMTLCVLCHKKKTNKDINIVHWDRSDKEGGLVATDGEGVPLERLWFYSQADRDILERGLEALRLIASGEAQKAMLLAHVWNNYHLTDASSPAQLVSQVGLDPQESSKLANTFIAMEKFGLEWPTGMNLQKAQLSVKCAEKLHISGKEPEDIDESIESLQELISYAAGFSYTDFERELIEKGFLDGVIKGRNTENLYFYIPRSELDRVVSVFSGTDELMAIRCGENSGIAVRVDRVISPLRRHGHKLSIKDGISERDIEIISLRG